MISESELYTVFELYLQQGKCFGFCVVNSMPLSYAKVQDFGLFRGRGQDKTWFSFDPMAYSAADAHRLNLGFRVDRYEFGTNALISENLFLVDCKGWSLHRP
jgi:hypothetical protein